MASIQIDSFVEKFKLLQGAGYKASLSFESELGEVSISLSCKFGINTPLHHHCRHFWEEEVHHIIED